MEVNFTKAKCQQDSSGVWLSILVNAPVKAKEFCFNLKDRLYTAELKEHREKRSLDANAYAWVLMSKIADALHTDKDQVYLKMLERYGQFTHVIVKPKAVEQFKREYRLIEDLGEVTVNGTTGNQIRCYFGSSKYDTKQMATLIDGIVSECKDLDIETKTPEELSLMKSEWEKSPENAFYAANIPH